MSKRLKKNMQSLFSVWCFIDFCLIEVMMLWKKKRQSAYRNTFLLFLGIFPADCKNLLLFSLRALALLVPSGSGDQSAAVPQAREHLSLELHKEALEGWQRIVLLQGWDQRAAEMHRSKLIQGTPDHVFEGRYLGELHKPTWTAYGLAFYFIIIHRF